MKQKLKYILATSILLLLAGCETFHYYSQSIQGHSRLMLAREPIDDVINRSSGKLKKQLQLAKQLRQFAVDELSLPDNNSYLSFVDIKRKYPVWSVVATPEFSMYPVRWCYPVIGCAAYRGYFAEENANKYASKMRAKQNDVMVGGVTAYSTLGWFSDPLIPSMMRSGDLIMAEVMFHELAHQQLYVKGNSAYNEAFATVVGEQGVLRWLATLPQERQKKWQKFYLERMQVRNDFSALVKQYKQRLHQLYKQQLEPEMMRQQKEAVFEQMRADYEKLKLEKWQGKAWYGAWFKKPLNNARLAAFSTYRDLVPQFEQLLKACGDSFPRFYQAVVSQDGMGKEARVPVVCVS